MGLLKIISFRDFGFLPVCIWSVVLWGWENFSRSQNGNLRGKKKKNGKKPSYQRVSVNTQT